MGENKTAEEKGAIDFVVEEFKELKKGIYGENKKMVENESRPSKPKPKARTQQQIQVEKLMEDKKSKEQLYQETLAKMLATQKEKWRMSNSEDKVLINMHIGQALTII